MLLRPTFGALNNLDSPAQSKEIAISNFHPSEADQPDELMSELINKESADFTTHRNSAPVHEEWQKSGSNFVFNHLPQVDEIEKEEYEVQ